MAECASARPSTDGWMSGQFECTSFESPGVESSEGVPLCLRCLAPHSPHEYYCKHCGAAVGQFTPYIPFVDIPFYANFYGRLWKRVWHERGVPVLSRAFSLWLIGLLAPVMLVGLPFVILERRRRRRTPSA